MKERLVRFSGLVLGVLLLTVAMVGVALAAADTTATSAVDAGAVTLKDTVIAVATTVLPYAAAILAIVVGWRMARKFIRA